MLAEAVRLTFYPYCTRAPPINILSKLYFDDFPEIFKDLKEMIRITFLKFVADLIGLKTTFDSNHKRDCSGHGDRTADIELVILHIKPIQLPIDYQ